ncbi:hypothetical protein CF327_g2080 [Tilletia walkeri]|nr:hypothetical protein CF327_g2080 [Tilletia walkeri]
MFARRSTHKRRRSALRADKSRAQRSLLGTGGGRSILDVAFISSSPIEGSSSDNSKGKSREISTTEAAADARCLKAIGKHVFTHSLDVVLPLPTLTSDQSSESQAEMLKALLARDEGLSTLVQKLQGPNAFYHVKVPLSLFLSPEFVTGFIRNGSLIALSMTSHPDVSSEDIIALDGQGILTLSLTRETYQTLGLVGRESRFHRGPSGRYGDRESGDVQRYIVELPLRAESFVPGKKGYERALACLKAWDLDRAGREAVDQSTFASGVEGRTRLVSTSIGSGLEANGLGNVDTTSANATWDMLFAWTPPSFGESGPSSHGAIHFPRHLVRPEDVKKLSITPTMAILPDVWVPSLSHPVSSYTTSLTAEQRKAALAAEPTLVPALARRSNPGGMEEVQEVISSLSEWTGLACLHSESIRTFSRPDPLVSSINVPTPRWSGCLLHLSWRGFFAPSFCTAIIKHLQTYLDASSSSSSAAQQPKHDNSKSKVTGKGSEGGLQDVCARSYEASTDGPWATVCADGFEHAPLSWSSSHPGQGTALGSGIALDSATTKRLKPGSFNIPDVSADAKGDEGDAAEDRVIEGEEGSESAMSEDDSSGSSSDEEDDGDEDNDEKDDDGKKKSHGGNNRTASKKNAKNRERLKRKRRGHLRQGETEHGRGRSGWTCFLLGRGADSAGKEIEGTAPGVLHAHVPRYVLLEDCGADTRQ